MRSVVPDVLPSALGRRHRFCVLSQMHKFLFFYELAFLNDEIVSLALDKIVVGDRRIFFFNKQSTFWSVAARSLPVRRETEISQTSSTRRLDLDRFVWGTFLRVEVVLIFFARFSVSEKKIMSSTQLVTHATLPSHPLDATCDNWHYWHFDIDDVMRTYDESEKCRTFSEGWVSQNCPNRSECSSTLLTICTYGSSNAQRVLWPKARIGHSSRFFPNQELRA